MISERALSSSSVAQIYGRAGGGKAEGQKIRLYKTGYRPFYSDKYQKKTLLAGELFYPDELMAHLRYHGVEKPYPHGVYGASVYGRYA
jgi:hypothetical protein